MRRHPPFKDRFEQKVERIPGVDCHLWTACLIARDYGGIQHNGKIKRAHRVAYELYVGPIPDGMCVLHRCDTPACVNPDHLFVGTPADNSEDMCSKGRSPKGVRNGRAKLEESQILAIRADPRSQRTIGKEYGISRIQVRHIKRRIQWQHVNEECDESANTI